MNKLYLKTGVAVAALCLFPNAALAQNDDIVVTATGTETPRSEIGQAISVIGTEQLEREQSATIGDILASVPGVAVARLGGVGTQSSVFIRGGSSSQTLVLIDGVRINDPSSPNAAFDFGALLTGNIDRVEVLRGPNSVIWGSQAIGGVVNVRNAVPSEGFAVNAMAEYGSYDTAQARANISGKSGIFSGSFGGGYYHTNGVSALSAGTERDGYENISLNGKLDIAFTDALSLDLRGYYNNGKVEFDDPFAFSPDTFPTTRNEQFIGYAGLKSSLLDDRLKQRISYSRTEIDRKGEEPGVAFSFNENRLKGKIDRFEYFASFDMIDAVSLVAGLEHERNSASSFFPAGGGAGPNVGKFEVTSGFGQLSVRPLPGLTVTGGVRHDDYSQHGGQTTIGANFAFTPNEGKTVFRGTIAEGFRAPTLTEAFMPGGNMALNPETSNSFDLGVEQSFLDGRIKLSATYFDIKSSDTIVYSFATNQSENVARTRSNGVEIELAIRPTDKLSINAQYSHVDATDRTPGFTFGNELARRPQDMGRFAIDWETPIGLSIGSTMILRGDSFDNSFNTSRLDGAVTTNLRAAYPVNDALEIFGRVENLFDTDYQVARGYNTLGRNAYIGIRAKY